MGRHRPPHHPTAHARQPVDPPDSEPRRRHESHMGHHGPSHRPTDHSRRPVDHPPAGRGDLMNTAWAGGLARHRSGRLLAAVAGIALAVALIASLGSFLTASKATMTQRAVGSVAVDWQVEVQPGAGAGATLSLVRHTPGVQAAVPVGFAHSSAFTAKAQGTTQTTGPGMVLGLPADYQKLFPGEIRPLTGSSSGVLLAQQTAS